MVGAVIGDIIGSKFEFNSYKKREFELFDSEHEFTDDTVMTVCIAEALMRSWDKDQFETLGEVAKDTMLDLGYWYPVCGYGGRFYKWMYSNNPQPYESCGNGAAMRVSPVGLITRSLEEAIEMSRKVTEVTHNHPEGIKGAEAVTVAIYLARQGVSKPAIERYIRENYYPEIKSVEEYHKETIGHGKELCQISVPQAFAAFFEGNDYESVIRNCVYIGGDTDTTGAIAGGIAEAFYGVPEEIEEMGVRYLDRMLKDVYYRWKRWSKLFNANGGYIYD